MRLMKLSKVKTLLVKLVMKPLGEAVRKAVWWSLWCPCRLVRLSIKLFGEAVRKAICKVDDADEADDADQV